MNTCSESDSRPRPVGEMLEKLSCQSKLALEKGAPSLRSWNRYLGSTERPL